MKQRVCIVIRSTIEVPEWIAASEPLTMIFMHAIENGGDAQAIAGVGAERMLDAMREGADPKSFAGLNATYPELLKLAHDAAIQALALRTRLLTNSICGDR